MKPRNTTQVVLRTTGITLLVLLAFGAWRTAPIWAHKPPTPAAGLPAGWTPTGTDLALNWSPVHTCSGNLVGSHSGGPWMMVKDRLVLLVRSREKEESVPSVQAESTEGFQVITLPRRNRLLMSTVLDDQLWCFGTGPQEQLRAYAIATDSGAITHASDLLPREVMATPFGTEMAGHVIPLAADGSVHVTSGVAPTAESLPTGIRWTPQEGSSPANLPVIADFVTPRPFYRNDGATLFAGRDRQYAVTQVGDAIQIQPTGSKITPALPRLDIHPSWQEHRMSVAPALREPSILLRQTHLSVRNDAFAQQVALADSIRSWQDALEWRDAFDAMLQKPIVSLALPQPSLTDEPPICIGQPLTLYGTTGTGTLLADDTSAALVESQQRRWFAPLQLFRLNPTEALIVQCVPVDEPGHRSSSPILRLGLVSASATQIQWLYYTRLPDEYAEARMFYPHCEIHVTPTTWTIGLTSSVPSPSKKDVELAATLATFPAPPGLTVDGTGWLISSR